MEVFQSGCSSVSLELPDSSDGTPRQVLHREHYSIDIAVVLASVTDNGSPVPASAQFLYGNAAAVALAFVFAAYTLFWIMSQPGLIKNARFALGNQASSGTAFWKK